MITIAKEELQNIQGGGFSAWVVAGILAAVTFLVGVFDGFTRPSKCLRK